MRTVLILAAMLALSACQPDRTPPEPIVGGSAPEVAPASEAAEQPAGSKYDPINRANAVEGDVLEQQESQDKAMDEQGG